MTTRKLAAVVVCAAALLCLAKAEAAAPRVSGPCYSSDDHRYPCQAASLAPAGKKAARAKARARPARQRAARTVLASADPSVMPAMIDAKPSPKAKPSRSLAGFPAPLVAKVLEIQNACGSEIASAYRPGAVVCSRGRCSASNHALRRAVDLRGNPACIYQRLAGWRGGMSTDYHRVRCRGHPCPHVHISWNPGGKEWGRRFVHNGTGGRYRRLARRH